MPFATGVKATKNIYEVKLVIRIFSRVFFTSLLFLFNKKPRTSSPPVMNEKTVSAKTSNLKPPEFQKVPRTVKYSPNDVSVFEKFVDLYPRSIMFITPELFNSEYNHIPPKAAKIPKMPDMMILGLNSLLFKNRKAKSEGITKCMMSNLSDKTPNKMMINRMIAYRVLPFFK